MTLLNDIQGSTAQIMVYSDHGETDDMAALLEKLGNLPVQLPLDCCIVWVVRSAKPLKFPADAQGRPLLPVHIDCRIDAPRGRWLQDPFLCLSGHERTELVVDKNADDFVRVAAFQIAAATGWTIRPVDLRFAGGNLLRLDDVLLVGKDLAFENLICEPSDFLVPNAAAWEALKAKLRRLFQVEHIVWVGLERKFKPQIRPIGLDDLTWQPFFHLDLFLMPGGRDAEGRLRVFVGEIHPVTDIYTDVAQVGALDALRMALEEITAKLVHDLPGLIVERLPILILSGPQRLNVYSLCNGWLDVGPHGGRAYLPDYRAAIGETQYALAIAQAHAAAEAKLLSLGIATIWVQMNFLEYASDGGALHCAVKVMHRTL
jgi:hypothetical protein